MGRCLSAYRVGTIVFEPEVDDEDIDDVPCDAIIKVHVRANVSDYQWIY
jgi:hypothetical protein